MSDAVEWLLTRVVCAQVSGEDDRGASLVEYALLVALIALVCLVAVGFLGQETSSSFEDMGNSLSSSN